MSLVLKVIYNDQLLGKRKLFLGCPQDWTMEETLAVGYRARDFLPEVASEMTFPSGSGHDGSFNSLLSSFLNCW